MAHLMYSQQNDQLISRSDMAHIHTPMGMGRFHQPVPFHSYINEVENQLNHNGIEVVSEEYAVTKDHQRFFGIMEITPKEGELITAADWKLLVGLRGSHDQAVPRGITLGNQVMVCSNLCFSGDLGTFKTKQTTHIYNRLPGLIHDAVAQIPEMARIQERKFEAYKDTELKPRWADAAFVEMFRRGGLTASQLGVAVKEFDEPTYEEHADLGNTVWKAFNASTQALKSNGSNMNLVQERSKIVSSFLDEFVGL